MAYLSCSPPRAPPIQYSAPMGTRWGKETAAAGGVGAFDLPTDPKVIGPWILGECVGKGASGRVKIAKHRVTGQLAAVKILPLAPLVNSRASLATQQAKNEKQRLGIDREITMMKLMNHPNIIRIYDVYEGAKELFLVLEYVQGGELFDFLVNRGRLPATEALEYFKQIIYGLNYAHTFSIIHRDLKPENILIASLTPPIIKIADWGMAAFAPPSLQLETSCGSPHYASPEIVNGERYQGNATDIWSCGVILYALLTGRLPFDDKNVKVLLSKVKSGKYEMPSWIDPMAMDLLSRMLVVDVSRRITIPEILSHPWLLSASKFITGEPYPVPNPPLPPSPSTLARPLEHPSLIDPELFASLRIIWGRHADHQGESIKRDLCAPVGKGVHAKAFYFLLGRYRDESLRTRNSDSIDTDNEVIPSSIKGTEIMNFDLGWELDLNSTPKPYDFNLQRSSNPGHPRAATVGVPQISGLAPPVMSRTSTAVSSRERPASPSGPRPQSWKQQPHSAHTVGSHHRSGLSAPPLSAISGPRPHPPRRGYTIAAGEDGSRHGRQHTRPQPRGPRADNTNSSVISPPEILRRPAASRARSHTSASSNTAPQSPRPIPVPPTTDVKPAAEPTLHAPVPIPAMVDMDLKLDLSLDLNLNLKLSSQEDMGADVDAKHQELPLLVAPRTDNAELQKTMDAVAERLNGLVKAQTSSPVLSSQRRATNRTVSRPAQEDKENLSVSEGWSYVAVDECQRGIGLGMDGVDTKMGKGMGNVVFLQDNAVDVKARKEKRAKHATLPPLKPKRSTISLLTSPITMSSVTNNPATAEAGTNASRLTSPVVGEFKGWFSNLFSWKGHNPSQSSASTGVIYSSEGLEKTRRDVGLLLEKLGVVVEGSGFSFPQELGRGDDEISTGVMLRCKVEEASASAEGGQILLKPVRFRVEFSAPSSARAGGGGGGKNQAMPLSPNLNSGNLPSPSLNALLPAPLDVPLKQRASVLVTKTAGAGASNDGPSGGASAGASAAFPPGCGAAMLLVHEKGSTTTFKNVWKKLKEAYGADAGSTYPILSPALGAGATPFMEQPQRFAI